VAGSVKGLYFRGDVAFMRLGNRIDAENARFEQMLSRSRYGNAALLVSSSCGIACGPGVRLRRR
jgi:hypothetical protein